MARIPRLRHTPARAVTAGIWTTDIRMAPRTKLRRRRRTKIVVTLGPASSTSDVLARLFHAGADVFRLNFSHGTHEDHAERITMIRDLEEENRTPDRHPRPMSRGRNCGSGASAAAACTCNAGQPFRLDLNPTPGNAFCG